METLTLLGGGKPRLFMVCVNYVGPSLGVFDTSKAIDLGLPAMDAASGPEGPLALIASGVLTSVSSGNGVQKFELGETLPVVPAGIVRRILRGDYIDMAELSEENLDLELRRSADGEEGMSTRCAQSQTSSRGPGLLATMPGYLPGQGGCLVGLPSHVQLWWGQE